MPSLDLFVVQVPILGLLKNVLLPAYQYTNTVNKFVCSLSTVLNTGTLSSEKVLPVICLICLYSVPNCSNSRKQINVKFEKKFQILFFSIF